MFGPAKKCKTRKRFAPGAALWAAAALVALLAGGAGGESLTPPYFNLAEGKNITASATCGEDIEGPELFCKLIGANSENDLTVNVIQGQYCDSCDPTKADKRHPPEYAVDGTEKWWQSPPLSRGMKYNEVNLTIDFGQEFHVAYVYIKMANSPRPGLWVLEKSADYGVTWQPWQYFSDSPTDCETFFGRESLQPISRDDSVICSTEYSKIVPLEGGEIPISLLNKRPSANYYFNSTVLQEWTRATNVRLRFLRTKNLLGHLMSVARQDPTVTRRYFYSIKEISIGGRCMCNGHADACDIPDPRDNRVLLCRCKHNTCGAKCDQCCPGFEQKAWRQSKHNIPFSCESCNCFDHSNECIYDEEIDRQHLSLDIHGRYEGGGVCQNCQHNTEGINCNKCKSRYFRPYNKHWNETDVCQPCQCDVFYSTGNCAEDSGRCECRKEFTPPNCDRCSFGYYGYPDCKPCECFLNGTTGLQCSARDGGCSCLPNFGGPFCKECAPGYFNFPECTRCQCDSLGSVSETCDQVTGNCTCRNKYAGAKCEQCRDGYFYTNNDCVYCNCDTSGTEPGICDKGNGQCICKPGYRGERCDECILGYYGYPDCKPCDCSKIGSHGTTCSNTGKCSCLVNYAGRTCDQCSPGFYNYSECAPCDCDYHGSNGVSCDQLGKCECHENFAGQHCDTCKEGYYNFPACEDCNCHPAGVIEGFAGCGSVPAGELCQCKERVRGRICDQCRPLYWNLDAGNPDGCEECRCNRTGVLGGIGVCDTDSGQCVCKPSVVARGCSECADGTYGLREDNLFGCSDCGCDVGGSFSNICNKKTGQCACQSRVTGRTCKEPLQAHYFPTLYQYQYEVEDGITPTNSRVRYAHEESVFPNYSWKGYAVFSPLLQREVIQHIFIVKPSLYRIVFRFVNTNPNTVIGGIRVIPENPNDIEQYVKVQFRNTSRPDFVTVSGETGNVPKPFVMNPGKWSVSINVNQSVLLDYFVLLPEDFFMATILNQKVDRACTLNDMDLCRHYAYPNVSYYDRSLGLGGFGPNNKRLNTWFEDTTHLNKLNLNTRVPVLNSVQPEITFNVSVHKPGQYVIVVDYITPLDDTRTADVKVISQSIGNGNLILYACSYSTMCRQVVIDGRMGVAVYSTNENFIVITLQGVQSNVGIHSVHAIPYEDWSLDFIKPRPVCIRKNGKCHPSSFRDPQESKKIQFEVETEGEIGKYRPPVKINNETYFIWLNPNDDTIDLRGKVSVPGYYSFILHYYQPQFPVFDLDIIIQNGQFYEAKVPVEYCPSESGCRAIITQADGNYKFSLTENFMMNLKQPDNKNVYLDYLLVVPTDFYNEKYLEEIDLDRTSEFLTMCAGNHFNIDTSAEGFCRDSAFSITAAHNSGALPCQCDFYGSLSFECEKFGGQCQCKDNIIGRQCQACRTGYYGFPDCRPCDCPSTAYCEPERGTCICPPHVTGENCDQCERLTYGYDPIIGCEECRCNYLGVAGSSQCDLLSGECQCKENIVDRQCDRCKAGHYSFPYCESCECDVSGTTHEICDQQSAECFCKKNVVGPRCDFCREGSFNLQASNEEGCTECFCFGKTTRCTSAQLIKVSLNVMRDWELVTVNINEGLSVTSLDISLQNMDDDDNVLGVDFSYVNATSAYFSAPKDYLGRKLTSYGGFLNYSIYYIIGKHGSAVSGPDVILEGANMHLEYYNYEQPPPDTEFLFTLQFVESNFVLSSGAPARREHIMDVLRNLKGIYLRATYWTVSETTRLFNVILDDPYEPDPRSDFEHAPSTTAVEQCFCPPNYQGLSCEECASGYYRIQSGPHGGFCVPCDCHGHATECDVNTGICLNCTHNTRGDHCDLCEVGYHGNALAGTPMDCLICACPLPIKSNNFATSCDLSSDGEKISCECTPGYLGARCELCAPGFYGQPEVAGDYCKPCQCSGNINPSDPASCDTFSGHCLRCLNNTFGESCAMCAPGFFGDAVNLKDCQTCVCDDLGTERCDSYTGKCVCKPNVIGDRCNQCAPEHYGYHTGQGCTPCDCAEASEGDQCEDLQGQCKCMPGVTGRSCDRCAGGYWNYTSEGCISCGCKSEYSLGFGCNALTGQCECLQGVMGEKCDQCPVRWAFVPDVGCHQCDSCHHALLDETDQLSLIIDPVIFDFDSTQSGYFTRRRLENMKEQLEKLKPIFDEVNPNHVNLNATIQELESLEQDSKNLNRKSNYSLENSDSLKNQSEGLKDQIELLLDEISDVEEASIRTSDNIEKIFNELHQAAGAEVDKALKDGQAIFDIMKTYDLSQKEGNVDNITNRVENILRNVTAYKLPVENLQAEVEKIENDLKDFNKKLDDLYNHTQFSLNMAKEAENIISKSGKERLKNKLEDIENRVTQSKTNLDESTQLLTNASNLLDSSIGKLKDLQDAPEVLETNNNNFRSQLENNREELDAIENLKPQVQEHAQNMSERVQQLEHILSESQFGSADAIKAARAYKDIVAAVRSARAAADSAHNDTNDAAEILGNVHERTNDAESISAKVLLEAFDLLEEKHKLEPKLRELLAAYEPVEKTYHTDEELLKEVEKILENIQVKDLGEAYKEASNNAEGALESMADVKDVVDSSFSELSKETQQAQLLPKELDDMKRSLVQTEKQINAVNEKLPPVVESLNELPKMQEDYKKKSDGIQSNLKKLTQQIELARDIANRIKVGVKFLPNTTLELRNPKNIESLSTSTKFSGYFKTDQPNGLVFYIGNPNGTNLPKTKSDDYMALIIQNGYPVLKLNIGNGNEQIINPKYVSDNNWYQYIVERVGYNAKLAIREELGDGTDNVVEREKALSGPYTMFNLDKKKSKIFVGSFPNNYEMQEGIDFSSFDGEIEDLVVGNTPLSLWNFNYGYENSRGALERDRLVNLAPSTGYRFNGNGYAILDTRSLQFRSKSVIQLNFKTFASTGLLFLAGKGKTFTSIELQNGKVLYQYNLGGATKRWVTTDAYNDGAWHKIVASRDGNRGQLLVDAEDVIDRTVPVSGASLEFIDTISFGGYPNRHNYEEVTQVRFDGCINNVTIRGEPVDLRNNIKAFDVTPGCPDKVASMVSFAKDSNHHIGWKGLPLSNEFNVSLKFRTNKENGLIFYITDTDQDNAISLSLKNGYLVLVDQNIELVSKDRFNDSAWHVVSVIHNDQFLRMDTDDYGFRVTDDAPPYIHSFQTILYVGGLPKRVVPKKGRIASATPFYGCIADLTVNGKVKNFANTTDRYAGILDQCIFDDSTIDLEHTLPVLTPFEPIQTFITESPQVFTESPDSQSATVRGDGGNDFAPETPEPTPPPPAQPEGPIVEPEAAIDRPEPEEPATEAAPRGPVGTVPPTTPKPPPVEGCALPPNPVQESVHVVGYRFGTTDQNSRLEFSTTRGKYKKSFDFRFEFRTRETEGILFYVSDSTRVPSQEHKHYVAVYLIGGHVVFSFKGEADALVIRSANAYNDDKWHLVEFNREQSNGKLVIDEQDVQSGTTVNKTVSLDLHVPFYVGGLDPDYYNSVQANLNTTTSFSGCIRGISMNNKPLEQPTEYGVIPCSDNVEVGTFFAGDISTYMRIKEKFKIGEMFNIKMDIKPRSESGVLVAAHGKKDYYVLEMINGTLKLLVENGKGPVTVAYTPPQKTYHLCDGQWHNIQAVKSKNVVTLSVDNLFTDPKIGPSHSFSTDTGSALFLGGHRYIKRVRAIHSRTAFVGCIKNVEINNEPVELASSMINGNVTIGFCPTN